MRSWVTKAIVAMFVAMAIPASAYAYFYAATLTGTVTFDAKFSESVTTGFPTPVSVTQEISQNDNYSTSGTGSGQVDTLYATQLVLSGTSQTIDLTSLTDPAGRSINFARVREFIVQNTSTTAGYDVQITGGATNAWAPLPANASATPLINRYGSVLRVSDKLSTGTGNGNVVTSSSKTIEFNPGSNTVTINILILGGSAA